MNEMTANASRIPAAGPAAAASTQWRRVLPVLAAIVAALLALYHDTLGSMISTWARSGTYMHGFLVPPIVAWLLWRQREAIARETPIAAPWMLLPVAAAALLWLLGELSATLAVTMPALVMLLVLTVVALVGPRVARTMLFPLGFLFFAVPAGEALVPYFMDWTADFAVPALRLSGVPVYREGQHLLLPTGHWTVAEACSGVRYLIASVMVGVLFAYLNYRSLRRRLLFLLVSFVVPIVANWVRAYAVVALGHFSDNKIATGIDHIIYGWIFFGVVMLAMFAIGARWSEPDVVDEPSSAQERSPVASYVRAPWLVGACAVVLLGLPHIALSTIYGVQPSGAPALGDALSVSDRWTPRRDDALPPWKPIFVNPSTELQRTFGDGAKVVGLYIGYYGEQTLDRKLVSSENSLANSHSTDWIRVAEGERALDLEGRKVVVRTTRLRSMPRLGLSANRQLTVWQFYWIGGTLTASDYWAKAYGALHRLLGRGDDAAVVILYASHDAGVDEVLASFLKDNLADIDRSLQRARRATLAARDGTVGHY